MEIPGEVELRQSIRANLASEFQVASDLLDIGMDIFRPTVQPHPPDPIDPFELQIYLGLVTKACRQFRGIIALAEVSLPDVMQSNGRMLLETMLTAEFLMRSVVVINQSGRPLPDVAGYPLTRSLRANLYRANDAA